MIDAANVVGSRPDGWWRDRAGAARGLRDRLLAASLPHDRVVLVLEGAAKRAHPEGEEGHLRTVHAPGAGDDTIVAEALAAAATGAQVTVVTADRGLRDRIADGADFVGPSWLLDQL